MRPDAACEATTSWWCAVQRANDYSLIYQTRYHVYRVVCPTHPGGGWWIIAPRP